MSTYINEKPEVQYIWLRKHILYFSDCHVACMCAVFYKDCFLMADIINCREIYNILLVVVCDYIIGFILTLS